MRVGHSDPRSAKVRRFAAAKEEISAVNITHICDRSDGGALDE